MWPWFLRTVEALSDTDPAGDGEPVHSRNQNPPYGIEGRRRVSPEPGEGARASHYHHSLWL